MKNTKYFEEASAHFLTESMSYEEFEQILDTGGILPTSEDYNDWDVDYLEETILAFSETIEKSIKREYERSNK